MHENNHQTDFEFQNLDTSSVLSLESKLPSNHPYYQVIWLKKGHIELEVDFERINLSAMSLLFVAPCQVIKISSAGNTDGYVLRFNADFFLTPLQNKHSLMEFLFFCPVEAFLLLRMDDRDATYLQECYG